MTNQPYCPCTSCQHYCPNRRQDKKLFLYFFLDLKLSAPPSLHTSIEVKSIRSAVAASGVLPLPILLSDPSHLAHVILCVYVPVKTPAAPMEEAGLPTATEGNPILVKVGLRHMVLACVVL